MKESGVTRHISELLNYTPDGDSEPEKEDYLDDALQPDFDALGNDILPTNIIGSRPLRRRLNQILESTAVSSGSP